MLSVPGVRMAARVGASVLGAAGLGALLVARSRAERAALAAALARRPRALAEARTYCPPHPEPPFRSLLLPLPMSLLYPLPRWDETCPISTPSPFPVSRGGGRGVYRRDMGRGNSMEPPPPFPVSRGGGTRARAPFTTRQICCRTLPVLRLESGGALDLLDVST